MSRCFSQTLDDRNSDSKRCSQSFKGLSCANPVGGNRTGQARRAYIVNFRPASMIDVERKNDYDHGKAGLQKANMKGQVHGDSQK